MGSVLSFQKGSTKNADQIEANIFELILKMKEEEIKIDPYVKAQILNALVVYKQQIEKERRKGIISHRKSFQIKDLIDDASKQVESIAFKKYKSRSLNRGLNSVNSIRSFLFEVEKRVESDRTNEIDYEYLLQKVSIHAQALFQNEKTAMERNEQDALSVLFLKLFLKCPPVKISAILQKMQESLDNVIEDVERVDIKRANAFDAEEVKQNLKRILAKTSALNKITQEGIEEMKIKCGETSKPDESCEVGDIANNHNQKGEYRNDKHNDKQRSTLKKSEALLNSLNDDLDGCVKIMEKFCPPINEKISNMLKNKINYLIEKRLKQVNEEIPEILNKKKATYDKAQDILLKLQNIKETSEKINQQLRFLKKIGDEILSVVETHIDSKEKTGILKTYVNKVNTVNNNFNEVSDQKIKILNRIEGFTIAEFMNCLRQIYKTVSQYNLQVQQFPFPGRSKRYEDKKKEVTDLATLYDWIPEEFSCVSERKQLIQEKIRETLYILHNKAKNNDSMISALENLDVIQKEFLCVNSDAYVYLMTKLNKFNLYRSRLNRFDDAIDSRIIQKKLEIYSLMHNSEAHIFGSYPPFIRETKMVLNQYEKEVIQIIQVGKKEEIMSIMEKFKSVTDAESLNYEYKFVLETLLKSFHLILDFLDNKLKRRQRIDECMMYLDEMEHNTNSLFEKGLSLEHKTVLQQNKSVIVEIKKSFDVDEILNKIRTVEEIINVASAKINMKQKKDGFEDFKKSMSNQVLPMPLEIFKKTLEKVFSLKEYVEDMLQGDPALDSEKNEFLQEIFNYLQQTDDFFVKIVNKKNHSEPILELKKHFDFNTASLNVCKNTTEFVGIIRDRAKTFESDTKYYLGSTSSVDYYVIHENLIRLLEELDNVTCENDETLLKETVETMEYIKSLISQLDVNASSD